MSEDAGTDEKLAGEPSVADYLRVLRRELTSLELGTAPPQRTLDSIGMATGLLDHLIVRLHRAGNRLSTATRPIGALSWPHRLTQVRIARAELDEWERQERSEAAGLPVVETTSQAPTREQVERYLRRCLSDPHLVVSSVAAPLGGYSKDTIVVRFTGVRGADGVVMRSDTPSGPLESLVASEFPVLQLMHASKVPVAAPLWVETDPALLGRPFIVTTLVRGQPAMNFRQEIAGGIGAEVAAAFALVLADIHKLDASQIVAAPAPVGPALAAHVRRLLDQYQDQWQRRGGTTHAIVDSAFAWMRENIPSPTATPAIVHGDPTMRNLMVDDGQVTALLDWETWHVGDPMEDLAYCRDEIERFLPWRRFTELYTARCGRIVDEAALRYWSLWKFLRGAVTSVSMTHSLRHGLQSDLRTAFGGVHYTRFCSQELAKRLEAVAGT